MTATPTQPGFWPTPMAGDSKGTRNRTSGRSEVAGSRHHDGVTLCDAMLLWPTPLAADSGEKVTPRSHQAGLIGAAHHWPGMWMTPTARNHKDGATSLANTPVNGLLGRQVLTMPPAGRTTCDARRTLNPLFVEALMGWPSGWTDFGSVATEWSRWLRRMRCELWRLNCSSIDEGALT
jgi:hypothetical protein